MKDSVNVGCRPMRIAPRFMDPKDVTDAIQTVKTIPNSHFIEFNIEDETLYLHQENCMRGGKVKTK